MAQSDARFGYRAKLSRTDHDLSQKFGFTCAPGMLLPVFMDYATPSDSYYIKHDLSFMRTNPLICPAMIDVKAHFETFFVPLQMIYQPFENSVFEIKPILSSMFDVTKLRNMQLPCVSYEALVESFNVGTGVPRADFRRLIDMFDINFDFCELGGSEYPKNAFPMFPCAYQCIYQYYYRLDDKEDFSNLTFNVDKYYDTSAIPVVRDMFFLRYRAWDFDYFTSAYKSPIISAYNTQNILPAAVYSDLLSSNNVNRTVPINGSGTTTSSNSGVNAFSGAYTGTDVSTLRSAISTASIRQMFANEKLAMITGRTKKNYDSQVLAHYGVEVPHDVKHDITLIGRDTFDLRIGEVTSLASTELSPLGEIAGKGWAYGEGRKQYKFTAPCHGVIMTIFSIEPKKRYFDTTNKLNMISSTIELPTPEFDRLGNTPMYFYEAGIGIAGTTDNMYNIVGWKERFYFSKRRKDRVSRAFMHYSEKQQHEYTPNLNPYASYFISSGGMTNPNDPTATPTANSLASYLISPNSLDQLMLVPYVANWIEGDADEENWSNYPYQQFARDPFIVDTDIKCKKVSWMSKDGEPIYDV